MTKLLLGAYHAVGIDVLKHVLDRQDVADVAVLTHEAALPGTPDLLDTAHAAGVWASTEHMNEARLPFEPDVISLVYYRHLVAPSVIDRVEGRIFNLHPSLLPRHRGASSVPWAIIEGDDLTGITYHYVDAGMDTGDILLQLTTPIQQGDTQTSLYGRLMRLGAAAWPSAFELVRLGAAGVPQEGEGCSHRRGAPHEGEIDPNWDREMVERFIRAMTYPPLPPATLHGQPVRALEDYDRLRSDAARG